METQENIFLLQIKDNGIGIAKHYLEKLFRDENVSSRGTKNEKGTGLGLSIVKRLIDLLDIHFEIESKLQQGTTVTLRFP